MSRATPPAWLKDRRIAYVPYTDDYAAPGDRRRFVYWARERGVPIERPRKGQRYDLVVLSARADVTAWARTPRGGPVLAYDLIDSYLAIPPGAEDLARGAGKWLLRQHAHLIPSYRSAVEAMCARADIVICSTPEQQAVLAAHARDVRPILDVHEEIAGPPPRPARQPGVLRLFWEGLPQNLRGFEGPFDEALRSLQDAYDIELHVVTDDSTPRWFGRLGRIRTTELVRGLTITPVQHDWSPDALRDVAGRCDAGVIPLDLTDPLAAAKPENKLALMWRLGLPTVTSATPAYTRVMAAAGIDLTCRTATDWTRCLRLLAEDDGERARSTELGMRYVAAHHSPEALLAKWDELVQDILR